MAYDSTKPREELDFTEIYPDLDSGKHLLVFLVDDSKQDIAEYRQKIRLQQPIVGNLKRPVHKEIANTSYTDTRFGKILYDYGYKEPAVKRAKRAPTYVRPFHVANVEETLNRYRHQVEYDMDEQDGLFLQHHNLSPDCLMELTPEMFEILVTVLENEWNKLEQKMNSLTTEEDTMNASLILDQGLNNNKYGSDDGVVFGTVDDQKCAVCNESDGDSTNAIVFCDGCNIAVHQECYGIAFIPEGQWLCRKCMINQHKQFDCCFCPSKTGAFKQLDNSLWSHVVCGLWINELYFANPIYMEPIEGIDLIPKSRWRLNCYICKQRMGACIQCSNRSCFQAYHVTCAKRAGLYMQMTQGVQGAVKNKLTLHLFCDKHIPSSSPLTQLQVVAGINKTRLYYRDLKILNIQNDKLARDKQLDNKLNIFKWRTENNTPIAPKRFSNIVYETLDTLKIDVLYQQLNMLKGLGMKRSLSKSQYEEELSRISNNICKYWCLKRESKNGAPLIRKNNNLISSSSILYGNNSLSEIENKLEFGQILLRDLDKVIGLSTLNVKAQQIRQQYDAAHGGLNDHRVFPVQRFSQQILGQVLARFDPKLTLTQVRTRGASMVEVIEAARQFEVNGVGELRDRIANVQSGFVTEKKNKAARICGSIAEYLDENRSQYEAVEQILRRGSDEDASDLSDVENLSENQEETLYKFIGESVVNTAARGAETT